MFFARQAGSAEWAERRLWIVEPGRVRIREGGRPAV